MEEFTNWSELFSSSLRSLGVQIMTAIPSIFGAILILLIGWIIAKVISTGISKVLKLVKFDKMANRINTTGFLTKANISASPSQVVGKFFYYIVLLLVFLTAADTLGWHTLSDEISKLIGYLPNLLMAIIFFMIGAYIATFVRDFIRGASSSLGISAGRILSTLVFYLLIIIVSLTALEQAGMDTSIITSNLLIIIGTVMAAAAISYGIASRDVLSNILAGFFSRRTFQIGQTIELEEVRGKIVKIDSLSITVQTGSSEKVVIPTQQLITNRVKIIE